MACSSTAFCVISPPQISHKRFIKTPFFTRIPNPSLFLHKPSESRFILNRFARESCSSGKVYAKNKKSAPNADLDTDSLDEDSIEALFSQLEEDLKNDTSLDDNDDEITEEDLAQLEQELLEALGDGDDDEESGISNLKPSMESDDDGEEEEQQLKLKNWQLRRLATALKIGRRKTSIKSLAADLCLDRAVVLGLLRDPPPNLLLMCAALPDKVVPPQPVEMESRPIDSSLTTTDVAEPVPKKKVLVHTMKNRWSTQKRLKKVQVETLERVYSRTKRPTNAMISSIVHLTSLPRKTVVQWFEERRLQEGVPNQRLPFRRFESSVGFGSTSWYDGRTVMEVYGGLGFKPVDRKLCQHPSTIVKSSATIAEASDEGRNCTQRIPKGFSLGFEILHQW